MNKFELGQIVATAGVNREMRKNKDFHDFVCECLIVRYSNCDWGTMCKEDWDMNERAFENGNDRIFASYNLPNDIEVFGEDKIWIITEWDRSVTTILFPSEY